MIVKDLCNEFVSLTTLKGLNGVSSMFIGDLLSHVLANANEGDVLITVQSNVNTLAVASLINLSAIIFPDNIRVEKEVIDRAQKENIPLFKTNLNAKEIVLLLNRLGVE